MPMEPVTRRDISPSPSPGTPGEGRGEGDFARRTALDKPNHPHPNPLPAYRERGPERDLRLGRQLPHLHTRGGDGVQPAGCEPFVALEEAVDRVVLFDIAAFQLKVDDAAVERQAEQERR